MRYLFVTFLLTMALLFGAPKAQAQTDFYLLPDAGTYTIRATWDDTDYAKVCFFDVNTSLNLMCATAPMPTPHPDTGEMYCEIQITIANPGSDVMIRAYAEDASGNRSADSPNMAIADFTPPVAPEILR